MTISIWWDLAGSYTLWRWFRLPYVVDLNHGERHRSKTFHIAVNKGRFSSRRGPYRLRLPSMR